LRALISKMGSLLHRARVLVWAVVALVVLLALSAASATGARHGRSDDSCTWGASSVRAQVVDGRIVTSTPAVTGCIPR
jgi:hypothetical protein